MAKDRALVAAARCDLTPNPQILLIVVFLHCSTRRHKWLHPLKLKTVPGLRAEPHSGNHRRARWHVEVNPLDGRASTKEKGGVAVSGRETVHYAGNRIVVANRGRMAAVNLGGIVTAVAVGGSGGGFGVVNARVLA